MMSPWRAVRLGFLVIVVSAGGCVYGDNDDEPTHTPDPVFVIVTPTTIPTTVPRTESIEYRVEEGDTLTDIATKYGVTPDAIIIANNLSNPDNIFAGQVLMIPPGAIATPTS